MKSRTKKILGVLLSACLAVAVSFAVAACSDASDFPDFINPVDSVVTDPTKGYTVNVKSAGGLPLNNVRVLVTQNGSQLAEGITQNGTVRFPDLEAGVYDLEYLGLPEGYFPMGEQTVTRTSRTVKVIDSVFASAVIQETMTSSTRYTLGSVMHNFQWLDSDGVSHDLAETLLEKNAVVFNFWFSTCAPCRSEFPALNTAYQAFRDKLELFAFSTSDGVTAVRTYKANMQLSFPMGPDSLGLEARFGFTSNPVTVIIDRYGIVAEIHTGAIPSVAVFQALFDKYTSDNYTQNVPQQSEGGETGEFAKPDPDLSMPTSEELAAALNGSGIDATYEWRLSENDKVYTWPWEIEVGDDSIPYAVPTNLGKDYSYAGLTMQLTLGQGDVFRFQYKLKTEVPNNGLGGDILYFAINGEQAESFSGNTQSSGGWVTYELSPWIHSETIDITFIYLKDSGNSEEDEFVGLRSFSVVNAKDRPFTDLLYEAATDYNPTKKAYDNYAEVQLLSDGYYHVVTEGVEPENYPILVTDLMTADSPWRVAHFGEERSFQYRFPTDTSATAWAASFYYITYCYYGNNGSEHLRFNYYGDDKNENSKEVLEDTYVVIENYWMQFLNQTTDLVPVDKALHDVLVTFCNATASRYNYTPDEDHTWLELCYYYRHTSNDDKAGHTCFENINPVKGWSVLNANVLDKTEVDNAIKGEGSYDGVYTTHVTMNYGRQGHPGIRYLFTAPKTGVYRFSSSAAVDGADPYLFLRTTVHNDGEGNVSDGQGGYLNNTDIDGNPVYLKSVDDCYRYDVLFNEKYGTNVDFEGLYYLEEDDQIILQCALNTAAEGNGNEYDLNIEYKGATYEALMLATRENGAFTTQGTHLVLIAVDTVYEDGDDKWYAVNDAGVRGTKPMYIDFVHPTMGSNEENAASLIDLIRTGSVFDFTGRGGQDRTSAMLAFYEAAIEGKEEGNELYGMAEATGELVAILTEFAQYRGDDIVGNASNFWEAFACYYEELGPSL